MAYQKSNSNLHCYGKPNGSIRKIPGQVLSQMVALKALSLVKASAVLCGNISRSLVVSPGWRGWSLRLPNPIIRHCCRPRDSTRSRGWSASRIMESPYARCGMNSSLQGPGRLLGLPTRKQISRDSGGRSVHTCQFYHTGSRALLAPQRPWRG